MEHTVRLNPGFRAIGFSASLPLRSDRKCGRECPSFRGRSALCDVRNVYLRSASKTLSCRSSLPDFLSAAGVQLLNCSIDSHSDGSRGLRAKSTIHAGDTLVKVPRSAVICANGGSKNGWWYALVLELLKERRLGPRSKWHRYIESLPDHPPSVLWACEMYGVQHISEQLRPYGLGAKVRRFWNFSTTMFESCRKDMPDGVEWRDFAWASSTVQNRAFRIDADVTQNRACFKQLDDSAGIFGLLPGVDMLNHSVHVKTALRYCPHDDEFYIVSGRSFNDGEHVFISYGPKSNQDLLFFYGFVEGNNPADSVGVASHGIFRRVVASSPGLISFIDEKAQLLHSLGLVGREREYFAKRDHVDDAIMKILRVCFASSDEVQLVRNIVLDGPSELDSSLSLENELCAWNCIANECERLIAALPAITDQATIQAEKLRKSAICSASWDWDHAGAGTTAAEALLVAEKREVLAATRDRVRHFAKVSKAIGKVTTVLLPPTQSLISATTFESSDAEGTSGIHTFTVDFS
jgi:Rubisco LSMT substrate-binding/SET domain